ncbi:8-amino-7-oxononanoate synthase [Candidatus Lokiarchaeum ossiferum]|uniref:8-amino-7-oxononanoate synthase n=1 Tax=Candidatus Lokiarchaeum ossiferum TaxID=2951803 RepID=A0ABY6HP34_9ARCH|nr:8-amino-7-oxononanoate synthase [Candidatus Lokiarchaeum sp. B-35]
MVNSMTESNVIQPDNAQLSTKNRIKPSPRVNMAHLAKDMGIYPYFIPNYGQIGPRTIINGKETIMLGSNNYMGLANHPEMIRVAMEAVQKYGTGCTGSRYLNGTLDLHIELEEKLAKFTEKDAGICFSTGMQANLGVISGLAQKGDYIISDAKNHASIVDGCRLSYAETKVFDHDNMEDLERVLRTLPRDANKLVISDGVFSMEGNLANVPDLSELSEQYNARLMIDDAHGVGYLGKHGEGTGGYYNMMDKIDLLVGTFSKSFASIGGFVTAREDIIDHLQHHARSLIYSASLPPASVAAASKAIDLFYEGDERREQVMKNAKMFRDGLDELGFTTIQGKTPVVPIIIGDVMKMLKFNHKLIEAGVYTNPVPPPAAVKAMLRTSMIATHTEQDVQEALEIFEKVGRKTRILKKKK